MDYLTHIFVGIEMAQMVKTRFRVRIQMAFKKEKFKKLKKLVGYV